MQQQAKGQKDQVVIVDRPRAAEPFVEHLRAEVQQHGAAGDQRPARPPFQPLGRPHGRGLGDGVVQALQPVRLFGRDGQRRGRGRHQQAGQQDSHQPGQQRVAQVERGEHGPRGRHRVRQHAGLDEEIVRRGDDERRRARQAGVPDRADAEVGTGDQQAEIDARVEPYDERQKRRARHQAQRPVEPRRDGRKHGHQQNRLPRLVWIRA